MGILRPAHPSWELAKVSTADSIVNEDQGNLNLKEF